MDCYDEILEIESKQESGQMFKYLNKLARCPRKKDIQNCIILLLSIMNEDKIDILFSETFDSIHEPFRQPSGQTTV